LAFIDIQFLFTPLTTILSATDCFCALQRVDSMENIVRIDRNRSFALVFILTSLFAQGADARSLRDEQHCLALAIYWEARGEGQAGMVAVGWTILNRAQSEQFPSTPCGVIYQGDERGRCQFSWWCDGKSDRPRDWKSWTRARVIAARLIVDPPPDPTHGALFYHSTSIKIPWARPRVRTARIGNHVFYR
jgi:spore germination cell wall hydrolase CwlJ-like protein